MISCTAPAGNAPGLIVNGILGGSKGETERPGLVWQIWAEYAADISTGSLNVPIENIRKDRISKDE